MLIGKPDEYAVVYDNPVFIEHQPVTNFAGFQSWHGVDVDAIQKLGSIGSFDLDFSERRTVEEAYRFANQ